MMHTVQKVCQGTQTELFPAGDHLIARQKSVKYSIPEFLQHQREEEAAEFNIKLQYACKKKSCVETQTDEETESQCLVQSSKKGEEQRVTSQGIERVEKSNGGTYHSSPNNYCSTEATRRRWEETQWQNCTLPCSESKKKDTNILKDLGSFVLKTAAISGVVLGGVSLLVPAIGFTSGGVAAGSLAAAYQSTLGGIIVKGSLFSTLQSVGAAGLAASTKAGIVAGSAIVAKATKRKKE